MNMELTQQAHTTAIQTYSLNELTFTTMKLLVFLLFQNIGNLLE